MFKQRGVTEGEIKEWVRDHLESVFDDLGITYLGYSERAYLGSTGYLARQIEGRLKEPKLDLLLDYLGLELERGDRIVKKAKEKK